MLGKPPYAGTFVWMLMFQRARRARSLLEVNGGPLEYGFDGIDRPTVLPG